MSDSQESPNESQENGQNTPKKDPPRGKRDGWIEDLARRSTGLPSDDPPGSQSRESGEQRSLWKFAGLGIQFAATVAIFAFMGNALDQWKGWSPWGLISCSLVAVAGNLYLLIKESLKENKPGKPSAK